MRVLIVDDDELSVLALREALEQAGHETIEANDGHEALKLLRSEECRLVISDWMMQGMDGLELCRRIRQQFLNGYIYTILLTARNSIEDIVDGLSAGADDFLTKPFHPEELRVRVRTGQRILSLETREVAIFAMAKLAESRDPETGKHLERMRNYSQILTKHLSDINELQDAVDEEYVQLIYLTSPLHDIGKVGIPDSVLLKPGRISDREFDIMKTHTTIGAQTLQAATRQFPTVRYLRLAEDIALTHHERFDGSGYPQGLAGADIPLCGRIVALADVYDALTSKRVYKDAFMHDIARSMIFDESGKHFDPIIVQAFAATEQKFIETRERFAESELVLS